MIRSKNSKTSTNEDLLTPKIHNIYRLYTHPDYYMKNTQSDN